MSDNHRPDGTTVVRQTPNGTPIVRGAPECALTGLSALDWDAFDFRKPTNVSDTYVAVVTVKDLARQEGMIESSERDAELAEQRAGFEAEHADLIEYKQAAETALEGFAADLRAATVDQAHIDGLERELRAAKRIALEQAGLRVELDKAHEALDAISAARDQAEAKLKATIKRPSAEPVAKRGPGRPRKTETNG